MDNNNNIYYVYVHRRKDTNDVFYVGKGKGRRAGSKHRRSEWWNNIVNKAGGFDVEYVEKELSEQSAFDLEIELIRFYKECGYKLCNLTNGGDGPSGLVHTEEAKTRISEANKGNIHNVGRKHTEETRAKLSASKKGRNKGQTHNKGRKHSDASRANMSAAQKNNKATQLLKKPVQCSNGMLFESIASAVEWLRINVKATAVDGGIIKCCKGRQKIAYGFMWNYYKGELKMTAINEFLKQIESIGMGVYSIQGGKFESNATVCIADSQDSEEGFYLESTSLTNLIDDWQEARIEELESIEQPLHVIEAGYGGDFGMPEYKELQQLRDNG